MSYLSILQNRLFGLNDSLTAYKQKREQKKQRLEDVKQIKKGLDYCGNGFFSAINASRNSMADQLEDGVKGNLNINSGIDLLRADTEQELALDVNLSSALSAINSEISSLEMTIDELDTSIRRTNNTIWQTELEIDREKRRIREAIRREAERRAAEEARRAAAEAAAQESHHEH